MFTKVELFERGSDRVLDFCSRNNIVAPKISLYTTKEQWIRSCGYYRPDTGIHISLNKCSSLAPITRSMNWNWVGSDIDREPFGVLCHELGHHVDCQISTKLFAAYYGDYSASIRAHSLEIPLTSYCDNDGEWFAEMFRLFVSNHLLLKKLRPKTHELLNSKFIPVSSSRDWRDELIAAHPRILENLERKIRECRRTLV